MRPRESWRGRSAPLDGERYSNHNPPPDGEWQRRLKRPVYWLGNWQFACLDYYHPPKGVLNRCVRAEPYPEFLSSLVGKMEAKIRASMGTPPGWHLNTCLINYYGKVEEDGRWVDVASVGEHRDYEPGPVASLSFGESALFQFVKSRSKGSRDAVVREHWLKNGEFQAFGGTFWKSEVFHRVQRVKRNGGFQFPVVLHGVRIRRINLTFRFVPDEHIVDANRLPREVREDIVGYVRQLAQSSSHWRQQLPTLA
ncbi:MAG: alpha-ketoglutarate-dependent dioxygenase AlkB [Deltaproteobacteria bacterium]|nr:alpha-ketoglutarate-dependent dioxygenase AlkB [Deltaproteobacteria bacterium]